MIITISVIVLILNILKDYINISLMMTNLGIVAIVFISKIRISGHI